MSCCLQNALSRPDAAAAAGIRAPYCWFHCLAIAERSLLKDRMGYHNQRECYYRLSRAIYCKQSQQQPTYLARIWSPRAAWKKVLSCSRLGELQIGGSNVTITTSRPGDRLSSSASISAAHLALQLVMQIPLS